MKQDTEQPKKQNDCNGFVDNDYPKIEEDVPFYGGVLLERLEPEPVRKERRADRRYFSAFKLLAACLIGLGVIYIIDSTISLVLIQKASELTNEVLEIVKALIFTLSGYLFAKKNELD